MNHLKKLNTVSEEFTQLKFILNNLLNSKEMEKLNLNELDFKISGDEVILAIKKLKHKKSGGLQLITNDIIKAASPYITEALTILFNKMLLSGIYPSNWSHG